MRSVTFEALWRDGPVNAQPGAPPGKKNPLGCGRVGRYLSSNTADEKDSEHADASEVTPPTQ